MTVPERVDLELHDYAFYMRMEASLREFPPISPTELVFNYPVHYVVKGLENAKGAGGGFKWSASQYTKKERSQMGLDKISENKERRIDRIINAASLLKDDLPPTIKELAEYFGGDYGFSEDTIRKLAKGGNAPIKIVRQNDIEYVIIQEQT